MKILSSFLLGYYDNSFRTLCILDVLFYIAYSARYSLFVLMCRKTHITHSLTYDNSIVFSFKKNINDNNESVQLDRTKQKANKVVQY